MVLFYAAEFAAKIAKRDIGVYELCVSLGATFVWVMYSFSKYWQHRLMKRDDDF